MANVHVGAVNGCSSTTRRPIDGAPLARSDLRGAPGRCRAQRKDSRHRRKRSGAQTVRPRSLRSRNQQLSRAAPLPLARTISESRIAGGRIHVFGGRTNATVDNTARHDVTPTTNSWGNRRSAHHTKERRRHPFSRRAHPVRGGECKDPAGSVYVHRGGRLRSGEPTVGQPCRHCSHGGTPPGLSSWDSSLSLCGNLGCGGNRPSKRC